MKCIISINVSRAQAVIRLFYGFRKARMFMADFDRDSSQCPNKVIERRFISLYAELHIAGLNILILSIFYPLLLPNDNYLRYVHIYRHLCVWSK